MINSPHNPTGSIVTADDIAALTAIIRRSDIYIVSDEVYEHIIFDGATHESMSRHPELAARSFVVGSFGKTFHVTGWKVGYVVAPAALTAELRKVHQYVTFSTMTPVQHGIADLLNEQKGLEELPSFFQRKRDLFLQLMEGSRFTPLPCRGSYFQLMDYSAISDLPDADFAIWLTPRAWRGVDSNVADALQDAGATGGAVLLCEEGRDARARRGAPAEGVSAAGNFPALQLRNYPSLVSAIADRSAGVASWKLGLEPEADGCRNARLYRNFSIARGAVKSGEMSWQVRSSLIGISTATRGPVASGACNE